MSECMESSDMNKYESEQLDAIGKWKLEEPSVLAKAFGAVAKPVAWLVQKMIPQGAIVVP